MISSLLKLDPKKRPDVDELLSNPLVEKNYKGEIELEPREDNSDCLLQTIKYNPKDIKGLKKNLPKANYIEPDFEPSSCKSIKKDIDSKKEI